MFGRFPTEEEALTLKLEPDVPVWFGRLGSEPTDKIKLDLQIMRKVVNMQTPAQIFLDMLGYTFTYEEHISKFRLQQAKIPPSPIRITLFFL